MLQMFKISEEYIERNIQSMGSNATSISVKHLLIRDKISKRYMTNC